ncbi:hypothetical protein [Microcoleus asticus]|uniref:hypothetical protein n=1 Tax=Microcoleus asticus TaxID=2815231 RepID=UPI0015576B7D|nr:hypothetical protein [Microcoleus asticus]
MSKCTQGRSQAKIVNKLYLSEDRPIYGNLIGLKKNQMEQLGKLYRQRLPGDSKSALTARAIQLKQKSVGAGLGEGDR